MILINDEKTISIEISLYKNEIFDVVKGRHDSENWIPFNFCMVCGEKSYVYDKNNSATFTLLELNSFIAGMQKLCERAANNQEYDTFEFYCLEAYFGMVFYNVMEPNLVGVDCWINIGTISNGKKYGHDEGVRFITDIENLKKFCDDLKNQLNNLLKQ